MNIPTAISCPFDTAVEDPPRSVPVAGVNRDIRVMIASERCEWEEAFRLVMTKYQEAGYEPPNDKPLRFTLYHALPETVTLVAKHEGKVIMTFTVIPDNPVLGLPMESIFGEEIAALRQGGARLAEAGNFAAADMSLREFTTVFRAMLRLKIQYHASRGGDTWVITVNPKHRQFYTKVLGYIPLGPCRPYERVQGAPAEALLLDAKLMKANAPSAYQEMFGQQLPPSVLSAAPLPPELALEFADQSNQTTPEAVEALLHAIEHAEAGPRWPRPDFSKSVDESPAVSVTAPAPMVLQSA